MYSYNKLYYIHSLTHPLAPNLVAGRELAPQLRVAPRLPGQVR